MRTSIRCWSKAARLCMLALPRNMGRSHQRHILLLSLSSSSNRSQPSPTQILDPSSLASRFCASLHSKQIHPSLEEHTQNSPSPGAKLYRHRFSCVFASIFRLLGGTSFAQHCVHKYRHLLGNVFSVLPIEDLTIQASQTISEQRRQ